MVIDINQKKLTVRDRYRIYLNGEERYFASNILLRFLAEIQVFKVGSDFPAVTIQRKWAWFKAHYRIKFEGGTEAFFTTRSVWKSHYQCYVGGSQYEIFGHRGRKCSVYKDGNQIAWWDKEAVSWFNGDNYRLTADDNADHELLIAFCLVLDNYASNDKDGAALQIDLGNLGPQAKEFNPDWQPKRNF